VATWLSDNALVSINSCSMLGLVSTKIKNRKIDKLITSHPSCNLKKINLAKSKIQLIFGVAVFSREFEFSAKLRPTEKNFG